ncbi:MAG: PQQ-binding-like beta-propeller repeat protein [Verrucomicrobiales bacterium]|nr:PQQ-binding-like beta-propeller repeat protein [Verrucomicrobiales bacterium]
MNFFYRCLGLLLCYGLLVSGHFMAQAGDWPMWRYDAGRGAWTADALPEGLQLQWVRDLPKAAPAWPETQPKLQFDAVAQPVVMGQRIFVPSSRYDSVTAYSTRTGKELWRFYSNGPVRFAPIADKGKVYFVSDDGFLYALEAASGKMLWKVKGGPEQRRLLLGNRRLISSWPARGGVVLHQDKLYFGASIWPFMGIFIRAVDPETGEVLWTNSGDGTNYINQPHGGAVAFSGLVPQGHLAASGNELVVPGGRSVPGVYDAKTGKQLNFAFSEGKKEGGHQVGAVGELLFAQDRAFTLQDGLAIGGGAPAVFNHQQMLAAGPKSILIRSAQVEMKEIEQTDRRGKKIKKTTVSYKTLSQEELSEPIKGRWMMAAGDTFYAGGKDLVSAYQSGKKSPIWSAKIKGEVVSMLAADDRLFVLNNEGALYCFASHAPKDGVSKLSLPTDKLTATTKDAWTSKVKDMLATKGSGEGYAMVFGVASGRLLDELLLQSKLNIIVLEQDAKKADGFRRRMQALGSYGSRIALIEGELELGGLPTYLCNLITAENADFLQLLVKKNSQVKRVFNALRPYGGLLSVPMSDEQHQSLLRRVSSDQALAQAQIKRAGQMTSLVRAGALPDSDMWTHQYGNVEQTLVSRDKRVKAPFGVLWFGGASHAGILPRHGHGPSPQVAGGRLFIEGPDMLRASDVYTGRVMWEHKIPGFGEYFNRTDHFAGAGETGSNYVSMADHVYAMMEHEILELNAENGKLEKKFLLPTTDKKKPYAVKDRWGSIRVSGDYLIATAMPLALEGDDKKKGGKLNTGQGSGSRLLVVYDRHSGKLLWQKSAQFNFRHNNIAVADDRIFCIDRLTEQKEKSLARRGLKFSGKPTLYCLDLGSGDVLWQRDKDIFGTFLNYSRQYDILLQAGSAYRDRAKDESGKGMMALRGESGKVIWFDEKIEYNGPCLLWKDKILTNGAGGFAVELLNGRKTGWNYARTYGCNTAIGSEHLLTFRSGAAGFFDLEGDSGTGNFGGFKSSCTANLIVADGILNAPDYTRTCVCSYQNQTSLALIHMPEAEVWTNGGTVAETRWGINFGAPGDRRSSAGTLFFDYPVVGGKSPELDVDVIGKEVSYQRQHASLLQGESNQHAWLGASLLVGAEKIVMGTKGKGKGARVRLYFASSDTSSAAGAQVFDVSLQGKKVLQSFDLGKEILGKQVLEKTFEVDLKKNGVLEIELKAKKGKTALAAVEVLWE